MDYTVRGHIIVLCSKQIIYLKLDKYFEFIFKLLLNLVLQSVGDSSDVTKSALVSRYLVNENGSTGYYMESGVIFS